MRSCNLWYSLHWKSGGEFSPVILIFECSINGWQISVGGTKPNHLWTVVNQWPKTSLFHNGCRKTELYITEGIWVCPILINVVGRIFSVVRDGFALLCWSHSLMSYLLLPPWQVGCYRAHHMGTKRCRGFSGSEVMSFLTQDKSGNEMAINYKVRLHCNSNKCVCVWHVGWLIACIGHMALRKRDLRVVAQVLEI